MPQAYALDTVERLLELSALRLGLSESEAAFLELEFSDEPQDRSLTLHATGMRDQAAFRVLGDVEHLRRTGSSRLLHLPPGLLLEVIMQIDCIGGVLRCTSACTLLFEVRISAVDS